MALAGLGARRSVLDLWNKKRPLGSGAHRAGGWKIRLGISCSQQMGRSVSDLGLKISSPGWRLEDPSRTFGIKKGP